MPFKINTKTGDQGETSLFGGKQVLESDLRIESYGTVDELNAHLGLLRDHLSGEAERKLIKEVQDRLFDIGAVLATSPGKPPPALGIAESDIAGLEKAIDDLDEQLPELKNFILPGGHASVSICHIARCVCRRTERRIVALNAIDQDVPPDIIRYLNRLSDYLFMLARKLSRDTGAEEIKWSARK